MSNIEKLCLREIHILNNMVNKNYNIKDLIKQSQVVDVYITKLAKKQINRLKNLNK